MSTNQPMRVAVLDCETLDLASTAVVYEIAFSIREVTDNDYANAVEVHARLISLDIFEQLAAGRTFSADTLRFQQVVARSAGFSNFAEIYAELLDEVPADGTKEALQELQVWLKGCDEVWIMKPTFDSPLLHSLAKDFGVEGLLWSHRSEMDLRTPLRKLLPAGYKRPEGPKHRAAYDVEHAWDLLKNARFPNLSKDPE